MTALVIDPTCSTCHGSGKVMGGEEYHDCPSCRLTSRYANRWCDSCHEDRPVAGMRESRGEFGNLYTACARCIEQAETAWRQVQDAGDDELTLRAMAGDR